MKPRRENGATFVSPTTSGVRMDSARMWGPPWEAHSANVTGKGKSPACEVRPDRVQGEGKKQGRRRSIPSTTLPAPDIEIGSRHPVNCSMQRIRTGKCEADHTG